MPVLSTLKDNSSNINLLDLDDDSLKMIFEKCSLRELIILMKTCKTFKNIISSLPSYKNGIKELKEIYDTGIINMKHDTDFILVIANKNYSNIVLDAIDFRFHHINKLNFYKRKIITNTILSFISSRCKNITYLYINSSTDVTNLSCLSQCKILSILIIYNCINITNVTVLDQCKKLTKLILRSCISIKNLIVLDQCKMLKYVSLKYCTELTDVSFLAQCKNLRELVLKGCTRVTDITFLDQCKNLVELNIRDCTSLTQENVDSLRENLPDCNIDY